MAVPTKADTLLSEMEITMKAEIKGNNLVITIPCNIDNPSLSASGKSLVVASTQGNITLPDLQIKGKNLTIGLNAYIKA